MANEITVPALGESVTEAIVARWLKAPGERVDMDDPLVELETDKVTLEVNAQVSGTLSEILVPEGESVAVGAVLGILGEVVPSLETKTASGDSPPPGAKSDEALSTPGAEASTGRTPADTGPAAHSRQHAPAVRRLIEEHGLDASRITGTGKAGRLTKGDVLLHLQEHPQGGVTRSEPASSRVETPAVETGKPKVETVPSPAVQTFADVQPDPVAGAPPREERVKMTQLRRRIAQRLKDAQNTAAILSTFNEINMTNVLAARGRFRDEFEKRHGCRLGLMSFFVKACVVALKEIPAVNAEIDGDDIVYKNHYDIGVAVGTEQGLVVPVLRDADRLSFAEIEQGIAALGTRAREGKLQMADLVGGTFTITNGGVYGSMMSTPILNPPQSGILGMHRIDRRPIAVGDEIKICPMMYVALSYDHRIIDGREAVTFLVRVKQCIEDPERILLAV